jgi:hypothetical protein
MPQQHLHHSQISPVIQQVGSEGVAQGVGREMLGYASALSMFFYAIPERLPGHTGTSPGRKYLIA